MGDDLLAELRSMAVEPKQWTRKEASEQRAADSRSSGCDGKAKHQSEEMASIQAKKTSRHVEPYRCRFCGFWHVGNR